MKSLFRLDMEEHLDEERRRMRTFETGHRTTGRKSKKNEKENYVLFLGLPQVFL